VKRITIDGWFRITVPDDHALTTMTASKADSDLLEEAINRAIREGYWDVTKITVEEAR
jgi:hypothetical protein